MKVCLAQGIGERRGVYPKDAGPIDSLEDIRRDEGLEPSPRSIVRGTIESSRAGFPAESNGMPGTASLIAALVAAAAGWGVVHHGRALMHNGDSLQNGGGWTAIILTETMVSLGAAAFAMS